MFLAWSLLQARLERLCVTVEELAATGQPAFHLTADLVIDLPSTLQATFEVQVTHISGSVCISRDSGFTCCDACWFSVQGTIDANSTVVLAGPLSPTDTRGTVCLALFTPLLRSWFCC